MYAASYCLGKHPEQSRNVERHLLPNSSVCVLMVHACTHSCFLEDWLNFNDDGTHRDAALPRGLNLHLFHRCAWPEVGIPVSEHRTEQCQVATRASPAEGHLPWAEAERPIHSALPNGS